MSGKRISSEKHKYYFGTKGILTEDILFIQKVLKKYGANASYGSEDFEFSSADELVDHCKKNTCSSIRVMGRLLSDEGPFFFLSIIGAVSNWEVEIPQNGRPSDLAVSQQAFLEVKNRLARRSHFIPDVPWKMARNALVWVPLFLLTVKLFSPSLPAYLIVDDYTVISVTLFIFFMNFSLAWIERRRYYINALVTSPSMWKRVVNKWPDISLVVLGAILSTVFGESLKVLVKTLNGSP